jgi:hypothetical protein
MCVVDRGKSAMEVDMSRLWKAVVLPLIWLSVAIACEGQAMRSVGVET